MQVTPRALSTKTRNHDEARTEEDSNNDKSRLATYIELTNAFKIKNDDEKNRQWFRERCSNPNRYKEFLAARTMLGRRQPGAAALADVLSMVAILLGCKKQKKEAQRLL